MASSRVLTVDVAVTRSGSGLVTRHGDHGNPYSSDQNTALQAAVGRGEPVPGAPAFAGFNFMHVDSAQNNFMRSLHTQIADKTDHIDARNIAQWIRLDRLEG